MLFDWVLKVKMMLNMIVIVFSVIVFGCLVRVEIMCVYRLVRLGSLVGCLFFCVLRCVSVLFLLILLFLWLSMELSVGRKMSVIIRVVDRIKIRVRGRKVMN